jgi:hypothetical protein
VFFSINGAAASFPSCNCSCPSSPFIFSRHVLIKNSHKNSSSSSVCTDSSFPEESLGFNTKIAVQERNLQFIKSELSVEQQLVFV